MMPNFLEAARERGWSVNTIGGFLSQKWLTGILDGNHGNLYPRSEEFTEEGVPYVSATNFHNNRVDYSKVKYLPEERASKLRKGIAKDGDVLFAHNATVGPVALLETQLPKVILSTSVTYYRCDSAKIHNRFLLAYLESVFFQRQVERIMRQTTRSQVPITAQKELWLAVPPLPEQKKIAEILSTWDRAIETAEALLATARTQKRALMQTLLTGKRRFPEFEGQEWREVRLGDVGVVSSAGVDKKTDPKQPEVRLLNFLDVFRREFIFDSELDHVVTAPPAKVEQCNVRRGDVFFTPSSETRDEIAIPAVAAENMPGVCYSYHVVRYRLKEDWDLNFRVFVFQTDDFRRQAYRLGDGSGQRYVISQNNFRQMLVRVPSLAEQKKIGAVLKAASDEVDRLEKGIEKLRNEKKALMQQLLTGKRRVQV